MPFDVEAARKAGASDDQILEHLRSSRRFDVDGAIKAGASKKAIVDHMAGMQSIESVAPKQDPPKQPGIVERFLSGWGASPSARYYATSPYLGDGTPAMEVPDRLVYQDEMAAAGRTAMSGSPAKGASMALRSTLGMAAPIALPAGLIAAPVATAAGIAAGSLASKATEDTLKWAGAPEGVSELTGDVAGLMAGGAAARRIARRATPQPQRPQVGGKVEPEQPRSGMSAEEMLRKGAKVADEAYDWSKRPVSKAAEALMNALRKQKEAEAPPAPPSGKVVGHEFMGEPEIPRSANPKPSPQPTHSPYGTPEFQEKVAANRAAAQRAHADDIAQIKARMAERKPPELIRIEGNDGNTVVVAVKKGAKGASQFKGFDDRHELQSTSIGSRLGKIMDESWMDPIKAKGYDPDEIIGFAHFAKAQQGDRQMPGMVYVAKEFRRQGLATRMYDEAARGFDVPISAGSQRPDGKAFREAYDKRPGVNVYKSDPNSYASRRALSENLNENGTVNYVGLLQALDGDTKLANAIVRQHNTQIEARLKAESGVPAHLSNNPKALAAAREMEAALGQPSPTPPEMAAQQAAAKVKAVAKNRGAKAEALAKTLHDGGITREMAGLMKAEHWKQAAEAAGVKVPSLETQGQVLFELGKMERAKAKK